KDALSANGNKGVTRKYPHTPGIDASGIVESSSCDDFKIGEEVLVTGYDLGMNTSGGFSEYIRVPSSWVVKLPKNLSLK
ncbi:oxidoreductase, partial [Clostridioides difficile]